ncbi:hypothetical protein ACUXV3_01615 [Roseobacteraceae bacterium NS-SX3]
MAVFCSIPADSSLTHVLKTFPKNSGLLLRLLNGIMCGDGELSRGEREAVAGFVSQLNDVPYCIFYHTMFSEAFSGPIETTNENIKPLLDYARCLHAGNAAETETAFAAAISAGWSEAAIYEVVEVSGVFNFINTIVRAAGLAQPAEVPDPVPTAGALANSYTSMA